MIKDDSLSDVSAHGRGNWARRGEIASVFKGMGLCLFSRRLLFMRLSAYKIHYEIPFCRLLRAPLLSHGDSKKESARVASKVSG